MKDTLKQYAADSDVKTVVKGDQDGTKVFEFDIEQDTRKFEVAIRYNHAQSCSSRFCACSPSGGRPALGHQPLSSAFRIMKPWKLKLFLSFALLGVVAIFAYVMHQHIIATSISPENSDARDEAMGQVCGMITGSGLVLIWLLPFLQKIRQKIIKSPRL